MNRLRCLLLTLCVITLLIAPMYAQKTTGILIGTVTDPSGAVVANAPVSVTDPATGKTRTATTDNQGVYSVPELQPGTYKVSVKAANFKEAVVNAVEVHVASTTNVNVKLQLGKASEQIEVEANAIQVQTDSAAVGETIDSTQVKELPLNGRSFVALTQLAPGVSGANNFDNKNKGLQGGVDFSVNGNSTTNNLFLVDGANNNDQGSGRTILIYPSIESIAEFKMLRNSYGPEYGMASGAVINIVTKGGTNNWHGSAFYNGRSDALNAWEYFAKIPTATNKNLKKPPLTQRDFGGSIGGPILKNKLFFFWSEEWNRATRGLAVSSCVATADEAKGDFSKDFHQDASGNWVDQCGAARPNFGGLPAAMLSGPYTLKSVSTGGALIYSKYPLPNQSTLLSNGANWSDIANSKLNWRQENGRVDYNLNKNNTVMFRYTQDSWENPSPTGGVYWGDDIFPALTSDWNQPSKMIIGKVTSTIGGSMVNDAEFSYSGNRINIGVGGTNPGLAKQITDAIPPIFPSSMKHKDVGIPTMWGGFYNYGANSSGNYWLQAPWNNKLDIYSFRDDISKVSGAHTWKAGMFMGWNEKDEDTANTSQGERVTFGPADWATDLPTGNPLANVLVPGAKWSLTENSTNVVSKMAWRDFEYYVGDTWKAKKNLTLELGVRYSLLFSPRQPDSLMSNWNPAAYDPARNDACNGLLIVPGKTPCADANKLYGTSFKEGTVGPNKYLVNQNYHLFAPRLGVAYDPSGTGSWAIRAGLGQFFQRERISSPYFILAANAPFQINAPAKRAFETPTGSLTALAAGASPAGGRSLTSDLPNSWQWNLSVEHSFAKETALQIGYVGNRAIHQTSHYDINIPDPSKWAEASFYQTSNDSRFTNVRPYNAKGTFNALNYFDHTGDSSYHSLQMLFKTRYKRSQLTAAYTWQHSLSDVTLDDSGGTGVNSFIYYKMPWLDRGNSTINRPHMFVANATYFFPEFKGSSALTRAIIGGWEVSGITTAASGASHSVFQGGIGEDASRTPCTSFNTDGTCAGRAGGALSNLLGTSVNGGLRTLLTGQDCTAGRSGAKLYNLDAFTLIGYKIGSIPTPGTTAGSVAPRGYCPGPRLINTDFSIDKNWRLSEKMGLQFRMDFFDLFNHPNFRGDQISQNQPIQNVNCGPVANGIYQPCSVTNNIITRETKNNANQFGYSQHTIGNAGRELQYSIKLTF